VNEQKKIDEDWKRRAQMEKLQDAAKVGDIPPQAGGRPRGEKMHRPAPGRHGEADFLTLVEQLASQALLFMGAVRDPLTGQVQEDPEQAQMAIDLLGVLEEKTRGNLTPEEQAALRQILDDVRMTFVRLQSPGPPPGPTMGKRPRS